MEEKSILLRRAVISARGRRKPFFRGLRACPFHLNLPSVSSIASLLTGERGQRPRRRPCLILRPNTGLLWSKFPPSFSLLVLIEGSARLTSARRMSQYWVGTSRNGWMIRYAGTARFTLTTKLVGAPKPQAFSFQASPCNPHTG